MLKVLLVPTSDYVGHPFPQRQNHIFERMHSNRSFEVHVVRFNLFRTKRLESSVYVHDLPDLRIKPVSLYYLMNMTLHASSIHRLIRREDINVVVLSNLAPCFIYMLLYRNNVPYVFDLPDYFPVSATGYIVSPDSGLGKATATTFEEMLKTILKKCDKVTVASRALLDYVIKLGVKDPVYVPNGVDLRFFDNYDGSGLRERFKVKKDEILVGYVGSLAFWLNLKPLLDGLSMAIKHGLSIKLLFVGGNLHTDYVSKVKSWVSERRLDDYVIWTGFVPYKEVPKYIAAMDLGVLPHDFSNPTGYYAGPNKIWEYLSQGKPVLAAPIPEAVFYREYVELVSNARDYFDIFARYSKDPSPFIDKAKNGRELAKTMTWDKSAFLMERTLFETIGKKA